MSLFQSLAIFWMTLLFTQTPDTLWTKRYGGPFGDLGVYVQETSDLGYIIAAHTQSDSGAPMQHYLIKTDSLGEIIWTKTFCRSDPFSGCIQETADSGYILTGGTVDTTGHMVIYLLKLNAQGDSLWAETIDGGGSGKSVQQTTDLGYIITGKIYVRPRYEVYLVKTDSSGNILWTNSFGNVFDCEGNSVKQTADGGYIITGLSETEDLYEVYLVKTDEQGDSIWAKTYGGFLDDIGYDVQQTFDHGYIVVGRTWSFGAGGLDVYLIKTDSLGDTLWTRTYGGPYNDVAYSVRQTADSGYVIAGWTDPMGTTGDDIYIIKTDTYGNIIWTKNISGAGRERANCIQQTADYGYIIVGWTNSFGDGSEVYLVRLGSELEVEEKSFDQIAVKSRFPDCRIPTFFKDELRMEFSEMMQKPFQIVLYNSYGAPVFRKRYSYATSILTIKDKRMAGLPSGIYFLSIVRDQKNNIVHKIIKF